jgi:hypothetical protein
MIDERTIDKLTNEARPVDFWMLRSYVRRAPSVQYARQITIPSLRKLHPTIWTRIESEHLGR